VLGVAVASYAARLHAAGVPITTVRYDGITHDFPKVEADEAARLLLGAPGPTSVVDAPNAGPRGRRRSA
jgi:acetyl esterase/lipase